jgi:hypothetical protein
MNDNLKQETWAENVILVDGDYIDRVAFDLTVNFERMLERRIPPADLARWIDCVALDGGLRPEEIEMRGTACEGREKTVQVILLHSKTKTKLENFTPSDYAGELDGQAFSDSLGEFCLSAVPVEELTTIEELFAESLQHICQQQTVKRLMVISDERYINRVQNTLHQSSFTHLPSEGVGDGPTQVTVFTMQPIPGSTFRQEILGYSLLAALGITGEEIERRQQKQ